MQTIVVYADPEQVERVAEIITETTGIYPVIELPGFPDEEVEFALSDQARVTVYLADDQPQKVQTQVSIALELARESLGIPLTYQIESMADSDWLETWKKYYHTTRIGKHIVVIPIWEEYEVGPADIPIYLYPSMAFGTGTHITTAQCLMLLEEMVRPGDVVYDIGCGSGILSIAAARLGAGRVVAGDLDLLAVKVVRENAERNGLSDIITVRHGDLAAGLARKADLVVANINADVILRLSRDLSRLLTEGGRFIVGGIIRHREEVVRQRLLEEGFQMSVKRDGDWTAISGARE